MENPEVTIVVPVYNTEQYLNRCMESVVGQTLENIEIILVDDGSTDSSLELCRQWEKRDDRVKVIAKENGGLSSARNAGAAAAAAPYVGFVDSDDFIEPDMYERLLRALKSQSADVAICGIRSCYSNKTLERETLDATLLSSEEAMAEMLSGRALSVCAVVKLYPKDLVLAHPFKQGVTYEDVYFFADVFPCVEKVAVDATPCYNWWHRAGSITTKPFDDSSLHGVKAWEYCAERFRDDYPELESAVKFREMRGRFLALDRIMKSSNRKDEHVRGVEREMIRTLKENKDFILACPYFGRGRKLAFRLLMIHPALYRAAAKFQEKRVQEFTD